ncbi:MAG: SMP-30/gluconolactonase/LRE family protein [Clostridia bacterium]|nr:SMP-30/gluconolactonase/LRE family protein [Clostridia bacterium]
MKCKSFRFLCCILLLTVLLPGAAGADTLPYTPYNYDYWGNTVYSPAAYVPERTLSGADMTWNGEPLGAFRTPQDLFVSDAGDIYVADTGNNRIVVLDAVTAQVKNVVDSYEQDGQTRTFSSPYGVAVTASGELYIADADNHRIVALKPDGSLLKVIENPRAEVLDDSFVFIPLKVCVDYADRVYCIARNMFEGIMVFESNGAFTGFFGTINVKISLWEKFWKKFSTKEERSKQQLYIATEFTGIDVDDEGFVYASNVDTEGLQAVRRLNPRGQDVIRKGPAQNLGGDLNIGATSSTYGGPSMIRDVAYRGHGIYSLLDTRRGRIFTYDHEGNLLYIFGGLGTQNGTFTTPVAIDQAGDSLLVLDSNRATVSVFSVTEYGHLINEAVALRHDGDETEAVALWQKVLEIDQNNELANTGIGKAYLTAGDDEKAMTYLKRGMNREYYSVAFKRFRNGMLKDHLELILTAAVVLAAGIILFVRIRNRRKGGGQE